jgi:hypothetical protein
MKKVFTVIVFGMMLCACGTDTTNVEECTCTPEEFKFFEEYYTQCIELCTAGLQWADSCGKIADEDRDQCLMNLWNEGITNSWCKYWTTQVEEMITTGTCDQNYPPFDRPGN